MYSRGPPTRSRHIYPSRIVVESIFVGEEALEFRLARRDHGCILLMAKHHSGALDALSRTLDAPCALGFILVAFQLPLTTCETATTINSDRCHG
jgi:hypothetical protein